MYYKRKTAFLFFAAGLISCATALYMPTQNDAIAQKIPLEKLQQGRTLYINKCAGCHNLYLPAAYTNMDWTPILDRMQKPAKITDSEKELIAAYLETNSKK
jgi:mono/diheme cytochrome c family protein